MSNGAKGSTLFSYRAITLAIGLLACVFARPAAAQLIISEFRLSGPSGAEDEFIEIYNNSGADHTVAGSGSGYGIVAADGSLRFFIPNGTVIPNRGHYLGCNSDGYSLLSYPAGNGTTATCDATYSADIALNTGIAIFNTTIAANFLLANRLDAVGSAAIADTLYKEGASGVRNLPANTITNYSYVRRLVGGCIGTDPFVIDANCTSEVAIDSTTEPASTTPVDTNNNVNDFIFVNTAGSGVTTNDQQQRRRGAPSPENLTSPIQRQASFGIELIDPGTCENCPPNRVRDFNNDPGLTGDASGSVFIRRKIINKTGGNVTRLRFRIVDITTTPAGIYSLPPAPNNTCDAPGASCAADLRALTSTAVVVSLTSGANVTVQGTTLEQATAANTNQPNGGGFYASLSANTVTSATPLANNAAIDLQFRLGVELQGSFRFTIIVEALP